MKNRLIPLVDKLLLRKRSVIETVNDQLKNMCDIEHTRHRSPINFIVNMVAGLIRYTYFEKKPSINFAENDRILLLNAIDESSQNSDFKWAFSGLIFVEFRSQGSYLAMEFLTAIQKKNFGEEYDQNIDVQDKRVAVIGVGDTAMDCVRTSLRERARNVTLLLPTRCPQYAREQKGVYQRERGWGRF